MSQRGGSRAWGGGDRRYQPRDVRRETAAVGAFVHEVCGLAYCKVTAGGRYPAIGSYVYNRANTLVGAVDDVMGGITDAHFTVKCSGGASASAFAPAEELFVEAARILPIATLLDGAQQHARPPRHQPPRGPQGRPQRGGFRGRPQHGGWGSGRGGWGNRPGPGARGRRQYGK